MNEKETGVRFDHWIVNSDLSVTLESPMVAIGSGHLDLYLEDPENAFGGLGIAIKMKLPDAVKKAFDSCEQQGKKLHVNLIVNGKQLKFVLVNNPDGERYPWRLVKE